VRRNSPKGARIARKAGLVAVAAAIAAAPVVTAASASAAPAPVAAPVAAGIGIVPVDYAGWYHWHCDVMHQWWRPRCHPGAPVQPGGPMIPSGSA
jgi:hypothetical protein